MIKWKSEKQRIIVFSLIIMLGGVLFLISKLCMRQIVYISTGDKEQIGQTSYLNENNIIEQSFYVNHDMKVASRFYFIADDASFSPEDKISVSIITSDNEVLDTQEIRLHELTEDIWCSHIIFDSAKLKADNSYKFRFESNILADGAKIAIAKTDFDAEGFVLTENNTEEDGCLMMIIRE